MEQVPEHPPTPQATEPPGWADPDVRDGAGMQLDQVNWTPVSSQLIGLRLLTNTLATLFWTAVLTVPLILRLTDVWSGLWGWVAWGLPAVALISGIIELIIVPRQVRAMGYAERDDDFLIKGGILFRTVTAIPYGRLQYLDVSSGPLQRGFGVRSIEINTAASATSGSLAGIPPEEAERLREQLTARGQTRLAGL